MPVKSPEADKSTDVNKAADNGVPDATRSSQASPSAHAPDIVKLDAHTDPKTDTHKSDVAAMIKPDGKSADAKIDAKTANKSLDNAVNALTKADSGDDGKWIYFLQVGAFRDSADAESARGKLALLGFESHTSERTSETGTLYRVRVGPFDQLEAMNRMRSKLSENSVDVAVVRTPKQ